MKTDELEARDGEGKLDIMARHMVLRDYFAGQAIPGLISGLDRYGDSSWLPTRTFEQVAIASYQIADAMLKARGA